MTCAPASTPARRARRRAVAALVSAVAAIAALPAAPAAAADGDLDHAFGGEGYAVAQAGTDNGFAANAVAVQPDGKVVVAGGALGAGTERQWGFARFLPNGAPDPAFGGGDGVATLATPGQGGPAAVHDLAIDGSGRIVAVGDMYGPGQSSILTVTRLEPDGDHDATFNSGSANDPGWYYLQGGNTNVTGRAVVLQPDGRIVVAGHGAGGAVLVRLLSSGAPDTSFNADGFRGPHQINLRDTRGVDVALQPDGRIVMAATAFEDDGGQQREALGVLRFTTEGELDGTFSVDGMTSLRSGTGAVASRAVALAVDGDGILVAGTEMTSAPQATRMIVARLARSDGDLDGGFGTGGFARVPGDDALASSLLVHAGGVYVGGHTNVATTGGGSTRAMSLARLTTAGDVDTAFGEGGVSSWLVGTGASTIEELAAYDGYRVIAAGEGRAGATGSYAAARFLVGPPLVDDDGFQPQPPGGDGGHPPAPPPLPPAQRPDEGTGPMTPAQIVAAARRTAAQQLETLFLALRNDFLQTLAARASALFEAQAEVAGRQVVRFLKPSAGTRAVAAAKKKRKGGKKRKKAKKVLATGAHTFTAPGTAQIRVRLTAAGKKKLKRGRRVRMVVQSTFTPVGGTKQVERRTVNVKVPGKKRRKKR